VTSGDGRLVPLAGSLLVGGTGGNRIRMVTGG
jgi:hypothetical protein